MTGDAPARAVHGAPARAFADAFAVLAGLSRRIFRTANGALPPGERTSARNMREAAATLTGASAQPDAAADLVDVPDPFRNRLPPHAG